METVDKLSLYEAKEKLIRQTVAQLSKDFAQFGLEITFPDSMKMAYPHVLHEVTGHLDSLFAGDQSRLASLLYHIDIAEIEIVDAWSQHPGQSRTHILAELILFREFKKVIYRNHYSRQKQVPD
ncbi:MAG: hypothetical protein PHX54_03170 [Lentimicrobiaceae bacterium]|nr:hypothetical protein [Lentimicrobiaceae bacterium]